MFFLQMMGHREVRSVDGSVWSKGVWAEGVQVTLRRIAHRSRRNTNGTTTVMCVEHLLAEMDKLR